MGDILISPLGLSPGAVTGLAIALQREHAVALEQVVTVGTSHADVATAATIVNEVLGDANIAHRHESIRHSELRPTEEGDASIDYMIRIGREVERAVEANQTIHIGVTAGRSGMGALAALATNVYGADHLWHFWVDTEIEFGGRLDKLQPPYDLHNKYLNPTVPDGDQMWALVPLPFLSLRPLHPVIKQYYAEYRRSLADDDTYHEPAEMSYLVQQLVRAGIKRLEDIFPATLPVGDVDWIYEKQQEYATLDKAEQRRVDRTLARKLERAGIVDEDTEERLVQLIEAGHGVDLVRRVLSRDTDRVGFSAWLNANFDKVVAAVGATAAAGQFLLRAIDLWLQATGRL